MPITNGYATLDEFQSWLNVQVVTEFTAEAERAVETSARWVDHHCQRHFWQTAPGTPRTFDTAEPSCLRFGPFSDLVTVTAVATDEDGDGTFEAAWAPGDYQLLPAMPAAAPEPRPARQLRAIGSRQFPVPTAGGRIGLAQVTGTWGWPAVPTAVKQACLIQASRLYKRRISPEGVTGFGNEFGAIRLSARPDPDAVSLLAPYRLTAVLVA